MGCLPYLKMGISRASVESCGVNSSKKQSLAANKNKSASGIPPNSIPPKLFIALIRSSYFRGGRLKLALYALHSPLQASQTTAVTKCLCFAYEALIHLGHIDPSEYFMLSYSLAII